MKHLHTTLLTVIFAAFSSLTLAAAPAAVTVTDPWVRGTVPAQKATGAFMRLTAPDNVRLVDARSPAAGIVELHQMDMAGDTMVMRQVAGIDLPAGRSVELKPGGFHIMLLDLKAQAKPGDRIPITLVIEGKDKQRSTLEVDAVVRPLSSAAAMKH